MMCQHRREQFPPWIQALPAFERLAAATTPAEWNQAWAARGNADALPM